MAQIYPIKITVISQEGHCANGHKVGDQWIIREDKTPEGICGNAYNSLFPFIQVLQYGGVYPWREEQGNPDVDWVACPDGKNPLVFKIERLR